MDDLLKKRQFFQILAIFVRIRDFRENPTIFVKKNNVSFLLCPYFPSPFFRFFLMKQNWEWVLMKKKH